MSRISSQWLFSAIYNSFKTLPVGYAFLFTPELVGHIVTVTGQMFSIGLSISLPIFGILFITDVLLGFTSKMMPQMNIFMVSLPLKIYLGLLLSLIFMRPTAEYISLLIQRFMENIALIF